MSHDDDLELLDDESLDDEDLDVEEIDELEGYAGARGFAAGLILGLLVGAGVALLVAPERGETVRRRLSRGFRHLQADARSQLDDLRDDARREYRRKKRELKRRLKR
ncbi:MAG: YtxH domain-containing protein [Gemmatimonadales bacterium]